MPLPRLLRIAYPAAATARPPAFGTVPLMRNPLISPALNPSCVRTSSLCSPSAGARFAGHLGDAVHLNGTADGRGQFTAGAFERHDDVIQA
jgi:hypothetical protein